MDPQSTFPSGILHLCELRVEGSLPLKGKAQGASSWYNEQVTHTHIAKSRVWPGFGVTWKRLCSALKQWTTSLRPWNPLPLMQTLTPTLSMSMKAKDYCDTTSLPHSSILKETIGSYDSDTCPQSRKTAGEHQALRNTSTQMNTRNLSTILFSLAKRAEATHATSCNIMQPVGMHKLHKSTKIRFANEARLWQFAGRMTTPVQAALPSLPLKSASGRQWVNWCFTFDCPLQVKLCQGVDVLT